MHLPDAAGYGAWLAILRAAGLDFAKTKLVVTAHGGTAWHRRGNRFPWTGDEGEATFAERQMLRLADLVICPSAYMRERLLQNGFTKPERLVVIPNALTSQTRSFGVAGRDVRPVNELVMMGRVEPRKGVDRFLRAVRRLADEGVSGFGITFLGKPGPGVELDEIRAELGPLGETARFITHYDHIEAVNYVKTRDCLVVIPSLRENLPYSLYECLENHVPVLASGAGGMAELVAEADRARVLVAGDETRLAAALGEALAHGFRPARLAFEPSLAGLRLAMLHRDLLRTSGTTSCSPEPGADEDVAEILYGGGDEDGWAAAVNRRVGEVSADRLLLRHTDVRADEEALPAMTRLMTRSGADAVVVGFRAPAPSAAGEVAVRLAPGGPSELGVSENVFGAGFFLIRRRALLDVGGFQSDLASSRFAHWVLLNRLRARGGEVIGVPRALVDVGAPMAAALSAPMAAGFADMLLQPWRQRAAPDLEGFLERVAIMGSARPLDGEPEGCG